MIKFQRNLGRIEADDGYADVSEHSYYKHLGPTPGPLSIRKFQVLH